MIIALGVVIRLRLFLVNRSLWSDEARLALNLINRSFGGLWKPLDWEQGAPIGFLMLQKCIVTFFGSGEMALRSWPLVAGVGSLVLFYWLAKKVVGSGAGLVGLGMMSVSRELIYYSSEVKQYSTDVLCAILILLCAVNCFEQVSIAGRRRAIFVWGAVSAALLWFSHPAVFVVAGSGITLLIANRRSLWLSTILAGLLTLVSFTIDYCLVLRSLHQSVYLHEFWQQGGFLPRPISVHSIGWLWQTFFRAFRTPGGFKVPIFTPIVFLIGAFTLMMRKSWLAMLMLLPPIIALGAAAADEYPYLHRLILFVLPMLFLVTGVGLSVLWNLIPIPRPISATICCGMMFAGAVFAAGKWTLRPEPVEEMKPVLAIIQRNRQEGDRLATYWATVPALRYYAARYSIDPEQVTIINAKDPVGVESQVRALPAGNYWIVVNQDQPGLLHAALKRSGTELVLAVEPGVSAYRISIGDH